jgi:transcriptional antiterminator RfaH
LQHETVKSTANVLPAKSWYLVYSKTRQEEVALTNLARQGFDVYLPRVRQARKRQGRSYTIVQPLFPRYLFIYLDTRTDNWGPIRSTIGVAALVRFGQEPARVPDELIEFFRTREGGEGLHEWAEQTFEAGHRVRVTEGAFRGYEGILLAKTSRERVLLLLDILGKQVRASIAATQLEHE